MKKKRILFLIESFIVGGAERVLIDIVNNLDANKYDITVCSVYKHSVYKGYDKTFDNPFKKHIHYKYIINNQIGWLYYLFNYLLNRIPNILYNILIGDKYDTVIAFYEGLPTYWIANAKLKRGKKIAWLHTTTELSQANKSQENISNENVIYKKFDKIIAVSQSAANSFIKRFPANKDKVSTIYNPIDIEAIQQKALSSINHAKNCFTFVSVGRITPIKGYDRIIRTAFKLYKKGYHFKWWIIGGGDITDLIKEYDSAELNNFLVFWGHLDNPYPYIKKADCFVSASYTEGLGLALIESLTIGTLVVSSNYEAAIEILGTNEYGLLFEQNDESFLSLLESILTNKTDFTHLKNNGIQRSLYFSLPNQINKIENIL